MTTDQTPSVTTATEGPEEREINVIPPNIPITPYFRIGKISAYPSFVPFPFPEGFHYRAVVKLSVEGYVFIDENTRQSVALMDTTVDLPSYYRFVISAIKSVSKVLENMLVMAEKHKETNIFTRIPNIDLEKDVQAIEKMISVMKNVKEEERNIVVKLKKTDES